MKFKTILIPIDKSEKTLKSIENLKDTFLKKEAKVILLHVIDEFNVSAMDYISPDFLSSVRELSNTVLSRAADELEGYDVEKVSTIGTPATEILNIVDNRNIDLIIMTKTGSGLVDKYILGSVTSKVVKKTDVPVMIIP